MDSDHRAITSDLVDPLGSAIAMAEALANGAISSEELVAVHLDRIRQANAAVNAVVTLDIDGARLRARESDARRAAGKPLGRLDGMPMTVKDSLLTAGLRTTSGATELKDHVPEEDAASIGRLKAGGANIFGKTNMPAWAEDIQTSNSLFGLTRNPWNLDHSPGGSSGGSAAALAMGFTPLEVGSDIAGSLRIPAHACGVYAHKPSLHLVPDRGHVPPPPGILGSTDLAVVGPMARTAADLGLLFEILADSSGDQAPGWTPRLAPARHAGIRHYRVAVWIDDPRLAVDQETRGMIEDVGRTLEKEGATVDFKARPFQDTAQVVDAYLDLVLPFLGESVGSDELAQMQPAALTAPARQYVDRLSSNRGMSAAAYRSAKAVQAQVVSEWARFFREHDVVICPVMPGAIGRHDVNRPSWRRTREIEGREIAYWDQALWCGALASFAFLPATARPVTMSGLGVPLGLQIVGPFMEDRTTLRFAELTDSLFGGYKAPTFARF